MILLQFLWEGQMSIYKRKWKTAEGKERIGWCYSYSDQHGKRYIRQFKRKTDAEAYRKATERQIADGVHTPDSKSSTVEQAADLWLTACKARARERSTIAQYQAHITLHILPHIGGERLSKLTVGKVRAFEDALRLSEPPRSPAMVRKVMVSLSSLLSDAQERGLVAHNVVRDLRARRQEGTDRRAEKRRSGKLKVGDDIPTPEEIKALVGALEGRYRPILLTAIFTGMRGSELRGLYWSDVDLKAGKIHVQRRADQYLELGPPKSESGERTIPLPPELVAELKQWRGKFLPGDLVFPNTAGKPLNHMVIARAGLAPAWVKAGVVDKTGAPKYSGLHALRHFYASWCINPVVAGALGLTAKAVQSRLGHSSIAMTMDTYSHLFPNDDGAELAAAGQFFFATKN
jgi:integrase